MTDPPTVPDGTTAVYINYSNIQVHISQAGNYSGWIDLQSSGEINLMSVINTTQTIAATNISSGVFNALRFNVTSAVVTFGGKNYTADLVYQQHTLFVPIPGGITIQNGQTTGTVVDMTPTVLLLGTPQNPTFAFMPIARGYTLPAKSVTNHPHEGDRDDYDGKIAEQIQDITRFEISAASLSQNSLDLTVKNIGNATVNFHLVALTMTSTPSGGWVPNVAIGSVSKTSEFFVIAPNGNMIPLTATTKEQAISTLALAGFTLAPGMSQSFSYDGPITVGALTLLQGTTPTHGIVLGQKYILTVLGSNQHAQTAVTAGSSTTVTSTSTSTITATSTSPSSTTTKSSTTSSATTIVTTTVTVTATSTSSATTTSSSSSTSSGTSTSSSSTSSSSHTSTSSSSITSSSDTSTSDTSSTSTTTSSSSTSGS
jgi:hypothetical protein